MPEQPQKATASRDMAILGGILLLGLILRLWFLAQIVHAPDFTAPRQDPDVQNWYARALVTGDWSVPEDAQNPNMDGTPYFRPPGHAYFLAAIYFFTDCSYLAPRIVNIALGLGAIVGIFFLARAVFGRRAGFIAAFLIATYWVFIFWEGELNDPIVFVGLLPFLLLVLRAWAKERRIRWAVVAGLLFGGYSLMRPNILACGPIAAAWMFWMVYRRTPEGFTQAVRRTLPSWCALLFVTLLAISPVTLRNYRVSGEFVPISTYFGENFLIGNGPEADGVTPWTPYLQDLEGTGNWSVWVYDNVVSGLGRELGRPDLTHSEASSIFFHKTLDYIKTHKLRTLRLMAKKALLFWSPIEITCNKVVHYEKQWYWPLKILPGFAMVTALFAIGFTLILADSWRGCLIQSNSAGAVRPGEMLTLVYAFFFTYYATFLPFFVNGRARVPMIPILLFTGAYGLNRIWGWFAQQEYRKAIIGVSVAVGLWLLASIQYIPFEPDHSRWFYQRASAYLRNGEVDKALEEASHLLDMPETASYMNMRLARSFAKAGRKEEACEHFMAAIKDHPDDPDVRFSGAYELIKIGKVEEGIAHYEEVLRLNPADPRAHNNLGLMMEEQERFDDALEHYGKAIEIDPSYALAHSNLGNLLARLGRIDEAVDAFTKAVESDPERQDYHYNLAVHLAHAGRISEAIERYKIALQLDPNDARSHNNLGLLLSEKGLYDEAEHHFQEALRIVPDFLLVYANWGNMLAGEGQPEAGIKKYLEGLEIGPEDPGLHNGLGYLYAQQGQVDQALHHYQEALRLVPDYVKVWHNMGNLYAQQGNPAKAAECYREALRLNPRDRFGHFYLGNLFLEQGQLEEAVDAYLKALENDPANADIPNNLAIALTRLLRLDQAVKYYEMALEINPDYANPHYNLGMVLKLLGRTDEAIAHLKKALELQPDYAEARKALEEMGL